MKFFICLFLLSLPAHAFRLSPMVVEFSPSGKGATQSVLLENPGKERVAIQLEVMKRKIDVDGNEDRSEASPDFVLFPEQLTLEPGQKRNVRLTWTGEAAPTTELPFRLVASQLPVALQRPTNREDIQVNLKFILQYVASLYITPPGAKSKVVVEGASIKKEGTAALTVKNEGNSRRVLEGMHVKFFSGKEAYEVPAAEMKDTRAQNVLAGGKRRLLLKVPNHFKNPRAEIRFE